MSETATESEPKIYSGQKRNRIQKASISWNGNGNGIRKRGCLKRVIGMKVTDILNKETKVLKTQDSQFSLYLP